MTERDTASADGGPDGLWRWLLGGLAGGFVVLGLLVAAYAVGYHEGQDHSRTASVPASASSPTTSTSPSSSLPAVAPVQVTPALVARGQRLYNSDGCSGCHSLTGAAGAGPSLNGVAGQQVTLTDGQTLTADDAYLVESIARPDEKIVKGYRAGIMDAGVASYNLAGKPDDIRALVAFIKSQK
jgi:cytochrome c2